MKTVILVGLFSLALAGNLIQANNGRQITLNNNNVITLVGDNQSNTLSQELGVRVFQQITQYNNANNDLNRLLNLVTAANSLADWAQFNLYNQIQKVPNNDLLKEITQDQYSEFLSNFTDEPLTNQEIQAITDVDQQIAALSYKNAFALAQLNNAINLVRIGANNLIDQVTDQNVNLIYMRGRFIGSQPQQAMNEIEDYLKDLFEDVVITRSTQLEDTFNFTGQLSLNQNISRDQFIAQVTDQVADLLSGRAILGVDFQTTQP